MPPAQRRVYLAAYCAAFNTAVARLLGDKAGGHGRSLEQVEAACDDLRLWGLMFGVNFVLDQYIETRSVQYTTVQNRSVQHSTVQYIETRSVQYSTVQYISTRDQFDLITDELLEAEAGAVRVVELLDSSGPRIWEAVQVLVDLVNQGPGGGGGVNENKQ